MITSSNYKFTNQNLGTISKKVGRIGNTREGKGGEKWKEKIKKDGVDQRTLESGMISKYQCIQCELF
jgi:hypothetical protein